MARSPSSDNIICRNRRATFRYQILEKIECGIALSGTEVKSLRERAASIEEAFARIDDGELWLVGCHIAPYRFGGDRNHNPLRRRKLLAHARQIQVLKQRVEQKGLTLVPLALYFNSRGIAKVTVGLVRGKKLADKRQTLQARDHQRDINRAMRRRR